ncbi:S-adenosylmethionine-dependent methyltransferase [Emydomyces testavorans]|uniref:S-adenosylmethionine-dependent methyltransferase n=1 Tax=Emydomyces testavorans TaxID=2070801 RepID=A0AAF0DKH4_9EURO|nr:S-adenosylmethionine-dependent methyltransferase [Emydomyces testavorans]
MANKFLRSMPKLNARFENLNGRHPGEVWDDLWQESVTPWDRGSHNPALEDALVQKRAFLGPRVIPAEREGEPVQRKKALVPGCGRGVDVFLLASFGYDAYGLEYSKTAFEECLKEMAKYGEGGQVPARNAEVGSGKVKFLQGDFFKDDWLKEAGLKEGDFDLIYDYTFFCALNPTLRPQWALRNARLLAPSPRGNLICLEFPTTKDPATSGPPFASTPAMYMEHLSHPGENVPYDDAGHIKTNPLQRPSEDGLERVAHWQPERTHEVGLDDDGNVMDWVSIWRRRN